MLWDGPPGRLIRDIFNCADILDSSLDFSNLVYVIGKCSLLTVFTSLPFRQFTEPVAWTGNLIFIGVGGGFGYWMHGVEERQKQTVDRLHNKILANREIRAEAALSDEDRRKSIYIDLEEKTREAAK